MTLGGEWQYLFIQIRAVPRGVLKVEMVMGAILGQR
jgi:hypothetical protein